ncbi:MAG: carboxypeptidase regulatory-like domain-containing protein, partial [Myxococcota bacterium]
MKKLARLSVTLLALLLVLLGAGAATAQDDTNYGELVIIVFDPNGLPVDGVRIRQEGATVGTTDDEGTVILRLRAGDTSLSFQKDGYPSEPTPLIPIVAGRSVEVLVTYSKRGGTNLLDIERPEGEGLSTTTATATGRIEGTIINDKGRPVEDARIFVRGAPVDARSDEQGRFVLDGVPATNLDLTIIHPNYGTTNKNDVEVKADETVIVGVEVEPSAGFSQEFVVTIPKLEGGAVFVLAERRESSSVADLLGADQIQKSGDSDAAAALQRVTGITLVGGRYVYVRGLGERYSTTLLDGSILPSPDPEQRVVPLDLFPASILGSIVVQKTYSPDLPGEFGGGTVNLRTRAVPEEFELKLGASLGYRTGTTFDTASGYDGTSLDFLGFGLDGRNPSPALREALDGGRVGRLS